MKIPHTRSGEAILRTIALTSVVSLHVLASLKGGPYTTAGYHQISIALDQLLRFCIPLFVALSGYGLMLKYEKIPFSWGDFLKRRVFKLLPAYFLWSLIFYIVFWLIPSWRPTGTPTSFLPQLLLGRADYHLYFVPMIFQLYLLFPLLLTLVRKYGKLILSLAAIFQVGVYIFLSQRSGVFANGQQLVTDQQQYLWSFSWIFYFVLGMFLPRIHDWFSHHQWRITGLLLLTSGSWIVAAASAIWTIGHGVDPIVALRFTRLPLLAYGSLSVITLTWLALEITKTPKVVSFLAARSYWLYLCHTLVLRILFNL